MSKEIELRLGNNFEDCLKNHDFAAEMAREFKLEVERLNRQLQEHEALLAEAKEELKALSHQVTECMEFLIWLKGYEYIDGPIEERLTGLLTTLSQQSGGFQ